MGSSGAGKDRERELWRDMHNAVALGMEVGALLGCMSDEQRPAKWRNCEWEEIVADVNTAAAALDSIQPPANGPEQAISEYWQEWDWYLTLEAVAGEVLRDPGKEWTPGRILGCLRRL